MPKPGKETLAVRKLRKLIDKQLGPKCWHVKIHGGGIPGNQSSKIYSAQDVGLPDLIMSFQGYFVGCEAKVYPGRFSKVQLLKLREIYISGGIACSMIELDGAMYGLDFKRIFDYANGFKKDNVLSSHRLDATDGSVANFFSGCMLAQKIEQKKCEEAKENWENFVVGKYSVNVIQLKGKG